MGGVVAIHIQAEPGFMDINHDRYLAPALCLNCHEISAKGLPKNNLAKFIM